MNLSNKVVLLTGSSQGIGKALATQMAAKGARVVLNGRNEIRLNKAVEDLLRQGFEAAGIRGDVTQAETCRQLVEQTMRRFGRLDILVNNAGIAVGPAKVEQLKPGVYDQVTATNYLSAVYMTRSALPHIRKAQGAVLFVSSIAGLIGFPKNAAYCGAKMALTGFAEALHWELKGSGVHVGIAYVGHTENAKGKTILAPGGGTMPKVHGYGTIRLTPMNVMAAKLLSMLQRRKFKGYYPFSARVLVNLHHYFPWLYRSLFARFLHRESRRQQRKTGQRPAKA